MKTSFKWHLAVLAVGLAVPTAAFSLEGGTREVPAKEILVPTADVRPAGAIPDRSTASTVLERPSQGCRRMEAADQNAR